MPRSLASIVEGHGEVEAVPLIVRRIVMELNITPWPKILPPIRKPASKLVKPHELENAVEFAARLAGPDGAILIVLDCDDGCPATEGPALFARAQRVRPGMPIGLALAKCEYEAWFLAAALSLRGQRGLNHDLEPPTNPESIRAAKGWLSARMPAHRPYSETVDQAALTAVFDFNEARAGSNSFDKFYREVTRILTTP